jgi:hypothetical protein
VFLAALFATGLAAGADETPWLRADLGYSSRLVSRGVALAGSSAQAGVEFSQDAFRGGVWSSQSFRSAEVSETDVTAGYAWGQPDKLLIETTVRPRWYTGGIARDAKHSFEAGLRATVASVGGCTPSLSCAYDFRLRAETIEVTVARSVALTSLGTYLDFNFFAGLAAGDDWRPDAPGARRSDAYSFWGVEANVPYRVGPHSTIVAGVHYSGSNGRSGTNGPIGLNSRQDFWLTLGVNLDF